MISCINPCHREFKSIEATCQNHVLKKCSKNASKEIGLILSHEDVYFNCTFHFKIVKVFIHMSLLQLLNTESRLQIVPFCPLLLLVVYLMVI